jgi:hypothetical protein
MRTDRGGIQGEGRRLKALVAPLFLSLESVQEEWKGKQDKGSVSRHFLSDCLHILFSRDMARSTRDTDDANGGNQPFLLCFCETRDDSDA